MSCPNWSNKEVIQEMNLIMNNLGEDSFSPNEIHLIQTDKDLLEETISEERLNAVYTAYNVFNEKDFVKQGVSDVFKENLELSKIGTEQEYSKYLNTIFPDSKVKDIIYRRSPRKNVTNFNKREKLDGFDQPGISSITREHLNRIENFGDNLYTILVNIKNPYSTSKDYDLLKKGEGVQEKGYDGIISNGGEVNVFEPEQIHILGSKEDIKGFKKFKSKNELYQLSNKSTEKEIEELDTLVKNLLTDIGVNVKEVNELKDANGNLINAVAKANLLNKIIEIVNGRADETTLPEEAVHFFTALMKDSPLYKSMYNSITSFKIYQEVKKEYRDIYNNDEDLIRKEAIDKLIVKHIIFYKTFYQYFVS